MRVSTKSLVCAWARSTNWQERAAMAGAALILLAGLAVSLAAGARTGERIWNPAWRCGEGLKGGLYCLPARR